MRIGILGSGLMGSKLGTLFARAGHDVVFSYARDAEKLRQLAREAGGRARDGTVGEAVAGADVVVLAAPWLRWDDVLQQAGDLNGKVVVSCCLPTNGDGTSGLLVAGASSGSEELARRAPGARIVAAFSTVPSEVLFAVFEARGKTPHPSLVYCGDDASAKDIAATLIRDVGFDPVDAGPLQNARYTEPFSMLVGQLAYDGTDGPALAYRFEHFGRGSQLRGSTQRS